MADQPDLDDDRLDYTTEEHETPVTARNRCRRVGTMLVQAELELKRARAEEMQAEFDYQQAKRRAFTARDCPVVERGGATVAERDAWVESAAEEQELQWRIWRMRREAAWDHYRRAETQVMLAQSILRSIDRAFSVGTGQEGG